MAKAKTRRVVKQSALAKKKKAVKRPPLTSAKVLAAIAALKDRNGSSAKAIMAYLLTQRGTKRVTPFQVRIALARAVKEKSLVKNGALFKVVLTSSKSRSRSKSRSKSRSRSRSRSRSTSKTRSRSRSRSKSKSPGRKSVKKVTKKAKKAKKAKKVIRKRKAPAKRRVAKRKYYKGTKKTTKVRRRRRSARK